MKKNMGKVDRLIRILIALVIGALLVTDKITGTLGIVLAIVAIVFAVTSLVSWCPAYMPFGISTCEESSDTTA